MDVMREKRRRMLMSLRRRKAGQQNGVWEF
jgi:hypothetical protein